MGSTPCWSNPQFVDYKIYWRYTDAPQWQFSRNVGNMTEFTVENIVIDNNFFGVASVSATGFDSLVVYPSSAGAFGE